MPGADPLRQSAASRWRASTSNVHQPGGFGALASFIAEAALFKSSGTYRTTFAPIGTESGVSQQRLIGACAGTYAGRASFAFPWGDVRGTSVGGRFRRQAWSQGPVRSGRAIRSKGVARRGVGANGRPSAPQPEPKEEQSMTMPGFTAEAALLRTRNRSYVAGHPSILAGDGQISPQFVSPPCACYDEWYPRLNLGWRVCYCRFPVPIPPTPTGIFSPT